MPVYGHYNDRMALRTDLTAVSSFRIYRSHQEALTREAKTHTISGSAIVRALLRLYFDGKVPEALTMALSEAQRAEMAVKGSSNTSVSVV